MSWFLLIYFEELNIYIYISGSFFSQKGILRDIHKKKEKFYKKAGDKNSSN